MRPTPDQSDLMPPKADSKQSCSLGSLQGSFLLMERLFYPQVHSWSIHALNGSFLNLCLFFHFIFFLPSSSQFYCGTGLYTKGLSPGPSTAQCSGLVNYHEQMHILHRRTLSLLSSQMIRNILGEKGRFFARMYI